MNEYQNLKLVNDNGILIITISRPENLNALNVSTVTEIKEVIQSTYDDTEVKGIIFTGEGEKAFVAGADINELAELNEVNGRKFSENGQEIFQMIESSEKPVIAAINGFALGGGCELAMSCHIRVAVESASFGQPEVNLGLIPGYGGTQRLTQLVGKGKSMELLMTADRINANEAKAIGLINHVVPDSGDLMNFCKHMLEKIISKAPLAVGMVIDCVNDFFNTHSDGYQTEANSFSNCCKSEDFKEGTLAFIEKRKANFKGV